MKRPESHQIGELGEIRAMQLFTKAGWIVTKLQPDYGLDLLIRRTDGYHYEAVTGDCAFVQVKATSKEVRFENDRASIRLKSKHREALLASPLPSFVLLVDLSSRDWSSEYMSEVIGRNPWHLAAGESLDLFRVDQDFLDYVDHTVERFWSAVRARFGPILRDSSFSRWRSDRYFSFMGQTGSLLELAANARSSAARLHEKLQSRKGALPWDNALWPPRPQGDLERELVASGDERLCLAFDSAIRTELDWMLDGLVAGGLDWYRGLVAIAGGPVEL